MAVDMKMTDCLLGCCAIEAWKKFTSISDLLAMSITAMMLQVAGISEMLVDVYQTTWHNPEATIFRKVYVFIQEIGFHFYWNLGGGGCWLNSLGMYMILKILTCKLTYIELRMILLDNVDKLAGLLI
jgi:hypothetical protein